MMVIDNLSFNWITKNTFCLMAQICDLLQKERNQWTVVVDEYYKAPYAYKGRHWVGYDDIESIKLKVINYYKQNALE
jgi:GH18 family chitinase